MLGRAMAVDGKLPLAGFLQYLSLEAALVQVCPHGGEDIGKDGGDLPVVALGVRGVGRDVDEFTGAQHRFFAVHRKDYLPFKAHCHLLLRVGVLRGTGAGVPARPEHGQVLARNQQPGEDPLMLLNLPACDVVGINSMAHCYSPMDQEYHG
jgi:hypothetical protein